VSARAIKPTLLAFSTDGCIARPPKIRSLGVKHYEALARELAATRDLGDFLGLTIETSVAPSASAE
jgi:hypothetical protein